MHTPTIFLFSFERLLTAKISLFGTIKQYYCITLTNELKGEKKLIKIGSKKTALLFWDIQ